MTPLKTWPGQQRPALAALKGVLLALRSFTQQNKGQRCRCIVRSGLAWWNSELKALPVRTPAHSIYKTAI